MMERFFGINNDITVPAMVSSPPLEQKPPKNKNKKGCPITQPLDIIAYYSYIKVPL